MRKTRMTDTSSTGPISLDSEQLMELDKLIDSLKKEILYPGPNKGEQSALDDAQRDN